MAKQTIDFAKLIQEDREQRQQQQWQGTFLEYLELVKADPGLAKSLRIPTMMLEAGCPKLNPRTTQVRRIYGDEPIKVYNFFRKNSSVERTLDKIVRYFHSRRWWRGMPPGSLPMGPVGSGKSSLVDRLIRGLEELPPIYAIDGDPMLGDPLTLVPRHLQPGLRGDAGRQDRGRSQSGHPSPTAQRVRRPLRGDAGPHHVVLQARTARHWRGAAGRSNNQDTSVLIGSEDISKLDRYSEGDPRILELNGAFNVGNRGMVEFIEVFKNETEYLHTMITATQERFVPAPGRMARCTSTPASSPIPTRRSGRSSRRTIPTKRSSTASSWCACPTTFASRKRSRSTRSSSGARNSTPASRRTRSRSPRCSRSSRGSSRPPSAI